MAVPSALECLRCRRRYPVVSMPAGCPSCSSEGAPANVAPVYARMVCGQTGQADRPRPGALRRPSCPIAARPAGDAGRGRHAADATHGLGSELGLRRLFLKDERAQPDRELARPLCRPGGVAGRGHASRRSARAGDDALAISMAATRPARACARSGWSSRYRPRARDAIEAVGGRVVGVRRARRALAAAGRRRAVAGLARRSRTAPRRRSAATRSRSRATARSPTRSPSSCAAPRPIW